MKSIQTISIIGTGNVAFHLGSAFLDRGIQIKSVFGRNSDNASQLANLFKSEVCSSIASIEGDLILICVSDDAIKSIIEQLPINLKIAYTSGALELQQFSQHKNIGVLYPLQTFSKNRTVEIFEVPFLIEANSVDFAQELFDLAWQISRKVSFASSSERKVYHLAAVWMNNFTNHLIYQSKEILDKRELNWEYLLPLLKETVNKLDSMNPYDAQTGPARRNDQTIIHQHEEMLSGTPKEIYTQLTKSIIDIYKK
jgi:predicted short-subunit dehydrogenase-like oxidoreductase (DUF2520 family)